jgi:cellulose synthase/poly-beta-1,6-N-acetylglucosamine synthase-like glycosyltransferase
MKGLLTSLVLGFNYFVGVYYGIFNLLYSILLTISLFVILRYIKRIKYIPFTDYRNSPKTPPVSLIIPAFNEERIIIRTIRFALAVDYSAFEVIVINDGSKDKTLETIIDAFQLNKIDLVHRNFLKTKPVRGFYYNPEIPNLLLVDKERGNKADALNCGINVSRSPYFCSVDADSFLDREALIRLIAPILESNVPIIACGGVVRVLNGVTFQNTIIKEVNLPKNALSMFQVVEYLRAFLFGRVGWDVVNSLLILSGAFTLFNKAAVLELGGYRPGNISEDMEIIVRLHQHYLKNEKPYRVKFVSDPICWTEVPEKIRMLGRQRRRWQLGLMQTIFQHKAMIFNPRYGKIGMVVIPYYVFFEMVGPLVEVLGYIIVPLAYLFGVLNFEFLILFLILAIFFGIFLSTAGIFLEELTYRRYPKWSDLFRLLLYGVYENFGYRQIGSLWRTQALFQYVMGKRGWEYVKGKGTSLKDREKGK